MKEDTLLLDVFHAYYDARRHKRNTHSQLEFEFNLEENLVKLYAELRDHTYKVGRSVCFITGTSVKREVFAAHFRDRVVHHLLYNYTAPIFECTFIADSYSCREGMGTLYGVRRFEHHLRSCSNNSHLLCAEIGYKGVFYAHRQAETLQPSNGNLKALCRTEKQQGAVLGGCSGLQSAGVSDEGDYFQRPHP